MPSRNDRLHALLARFAPEAVDAYAEAQAWPSGCPYVLATLPSGTRNITITADDGDTVSGRGATLDDALTALEEKAR